MHAVYSEDVKQQILQKVINRSEGVTVTEIADSFGVSLTTVNRWRNQMSKAKVSKPSSGERPPENWSASEKFEALMQSQGLNETQLSAFCRNKGIFIHHLEQWKADFIQSAGAEKESPVKVRQLTQQNQKLTREMKRKEKALAEAAALLVLQKKVQDIWNDDEDG